MTKLMVATALVVTSPAAASAHPSWEDFKHTHADPVNLASPVEHRERLLEDVLTELELEDVRARWERIDRRYDARQRRLERERDLLLDTEGPVSAPPGESSAPTTSGDVWAALAMCESSMTNDLGDPFWGYFQFLPSTWANYRPGLPSDYSYAEQRAVAMELFADTGWYSWPGCAAQLGLS